jgi:hypothetical protein
MDFNKSATNKYLTSINLLTQINRKFIIVNTTASP